MNDEIKKIVFSDFDGTITNRDSYIRSLFFYSSFGKIISLLPGLVFNLLIYLMGMISRDDMKKYSYAKFFSDVSLLFVQEQNKKYFKKIKFNNKVVDLIKKLKEEGFEIIIVTASPDVYMEYFTEELGYDGLICTKVEKLEGKLTGKLIGRNCNREEKVKRIKESEYYSDSSKIITLGNSKGDYPMLGLSDEYYYVINGVPLKNAKLN